MYYIIIARRSIGRAGWLTIIATIALIALVSAYNRRTAPVLGIGIGGLFSATVATQYLAGTSVIGYLTGAGGAGLSPAAAVGAALSRLAFIVAVVSIPVLLARPLGDSPLLEMDPTVDRTAAAIDDWLGRDVATERAGSFLTFVAKSLDNGARTATVVVAAYAAAGIAKSDAFEAGQQAFLLSLNKILVPFAFILAPGILLIRTRSSPADVTVLNAADIAELDFFLPGVVVPVLGMFAGVYALGPAIIGYYRTHVGRAERLGFRSPPCCCRSPASSCCPAERYSGSSASR